MAVTVDIQKILQSPVLQYVFSDPTTGLLAQNGSVEFFKTDEITPKNVYIQTGTPDNPDFTVANAANLSLNNAGALNQMIFLFPFNELDDSIAELYFFRLKDSVDIEIYSENNVPFLGSLIPVSSTSLINLAPSYGLDVPFLPTFLGGPEKIFITEVATYAALGFVWVILDPANSDFSYEIDAVTPGAIDGDPKNSILLKGENFGSSQTEIFWAFPVCFFDELIGTSFNFRIFAQDASTIPVTQLDIGVVRGPSADRVSGEIDWASVSSPISVGTIPLSTSLSLKTLNFTMPTLVASPDTSSLTYITVSQPKDQAFAIRLTGFYDYSGLEQPTITVTKDNLGSRLSPSSGRVLCRSCSTYHK